MQFYFFGRISSRMSFNSPASFDQKLWSDPKVAVIFSLKLSRSDISDLGRIYPVQIRYIRLETVSTQKTVDSVDSCLAFSYCLIHPYLTFQDRV
jgi:hypothetical protein